MISFHLVDIKNNLSFTKAENEGKFVYFFSTQTKEDEDKIIFYVWLKNSGDYLINKVWFYTYVNILGQVTCTPVKSQQDTFSLVTFFENHLSGYSKDGYKLPPDTLLDILYFEIEKKKVDEGGHLEFSYGSEHSKKYYFRAKWNKDEISKNVTSKDFLEHIKLKNKKYQRTLLIKRIFYSKFSYFIYCIFGFILLFVFI